MFNKYYLLTFFLTLFLIVCCESSNVNDEPLKYKNGYLMEDIIINQSSISFFAFGDFGTGSDSQKSVANSMANYAISNPIDLVVLLGDNFYNYGIDSISDPKWYTHFNDIYDINILDVPFYAILGNHDHHGSISAQIEYTHISSRWTMPSLFYSFSYILNDSTIVQFIGLDTDSIVQEEDVALYQLIWLDNVLNSSVADWIIVFGHHPLYSNGAHGDTYSLKAKVEHLFIINNVDLYLCGHDHNIEVYSPINDVHYIVSGGGGKGIRAVSPSAETLYAISHLGSVILTISRSRIDISVLLDNGDIPFNLSIN